MTADLSKQEWKEVERLRPRAYEGEYALTPKAARLVFRALAQREAERDAAIWGVCCECNAEPSTRCAKCFHEAEDRAHKAEAALATEKVPDDCVVILKSAFQALSDAYVAERAASQRLREALRKYGRHENNCRHYSQVFGMSHDCDCGLAAALAAQPDAGVGAQRRHEIRFGDEIVFPGEEKDWPGPYIVCATLVASMLRTDLPREMVKDIHTLIGLSAPPAPDAGQAQ